ncbi:MAG: PspA/IM30 family protein [Lachnospiraceae bacterium]|nr:PspA/IM30 family protein [Lachnospiraceae bacterium]
MGILQRFKDIMSANVNAALDKAEDPVKMVDQYMRNLEDDLGKVKSETAAVMAEEKRTKRELEENKEECEKMERYAKKALLAGNESDARIFLEKKKELEAKEALLKTAWEQAFANAQSMGQMHDKLCKDLEDLRARKESIKAKMTLAKTQEKMNKIGSSYAGVSDSMSAFDRMEKKADQMLDQANAMAELNHRQAEGDSVDSLMDKYDDGKTTSEGQIDADLEALKKELGL